MTISAAQLDIHCHVANTPTLESCNTDEALQYPVYPYMQRAIVSAKLSTSRLHLDRQVSAFRTLSAMASCADGANGPPQSTVIIGAGIIGCATAYYLSTSGNTDPKSIHLVEASPELFASASGKAGGFCTSDWFGPPTASLGALSFRLHQELADKHDGYKTWGYRRSTASSFMEGSYSARAFEAAGGEDWLSQGGSRAQEAGVHAISDEDGAPPWLTRGRGSQSEVIGEVGGVAQV